MRRILAIVLPLICPFLYAQDSTPVLMFNSSGIAYPSGAGTPLAYEPTHVVCYTNTTGAILPCNFSGGGGGATLPFPGFVFATSATGGTVATPTQAQTLLQGLTTPLSLPNGFDAETAGAFYVDLANNTSTGTATLTAVCSDGAGKAITCPHTSSTTNVPLGFATLGAGTTGNVTICQLGWCSVKFDNSAVAGDYAIASPVTDGELTDTTLTTPPSGQPFFYIQSSNAGPGTASLVRVLMSDLYNTAARGGGTSVKVGGSVPFTTANFNNAVPAANTNFLNVSWQASAGLNPNISAEVPYATSTTFGIVEPDNTTIHIASGVISVIGGGLTGTGTNNFIPAWTGSSTLGNSPCDIGVTTVNFITCTDGINTSASGASGYGATEQSTAPAAAAGQDQFYADSVSHRWKVQNNNGSAVPNGSLSAVIIAQGTAALGTSSISSAACATVVTVGASGVASTDTIAWNPNASIKAVTGYTPSTSGGLTIAAYPTSGNVNFDVCNWTSSSITPGAVTLNWSVSR